MIAIIDYSMGNVASIARMLKKLGVDSKLTRDPDEICAGVITNFVKHGNRQA